MPDCWTDLKFRGWVLNTCPAFTKNLSDIYLAPCSEQLSTQNLVKIENLEAVHRTVMCEQGDTTLRYHYTWYHSRIDGRCTGPAASIAIAAMVQLATIDI